MKKTPQSIGFLQALGVVCYCALIGGFIWLMGKMALTPPGFLGVALVLVLLVFSAAVTGSMVFGYAAYLGLNKKTKEALAVVGYTLVFGFGFFLLALIGLIFLA